MIWFTGLSGSGKSAIANAAKDLLNGHSISVEIVDGDELRRTRGSRLGFGAEDLMKSNRLAIQVCREVRQRCDVVLVARVSPFISARRIARKALGSHFVEVYVKASLAAVQIRDSKGLYKRALKGEGGPLIGMPGGVPYEIPESPDLILDTEVYGLQPLAEDLVDFVEEFLEASVNAR